MKYLPINQSVLKDSDKYLYDDTRLNNLKNEFVKVRFYIRNYNHPYSRTFRLIFQKYMHNDIQIVWEK
jgi:hypothetical protein